MFVGPATAGVSPSEYNRYEKYVSVDAMKNLRS
jgi:hypothetical protein